MGLFFGIWYLLGIIFSILLIRISRDVTFKTIPEIFCLSFAGPYLFLMWYGEVGKDFILIKRTGTHRD